MDVIEIVISSNFTLGWTEFGRKRFTAAVRGQEERAPAREERKVAKVYAKVAEGLRRVGGRRILEP